MKENRKTEKQSDTFKTVLVFICDNSVFFIFIPAYMIVLE